MSGRYLHPGPPRNCQRGTAQPAPRRALPGGGGLKPTRGGGGGCAARGWSARHSRAPDGRRGAGGGDEGARGVPDPAGPQLHFQPLGDSAPAKSAPKKPAEPFRANPRIEIRRAGPRRTAVGGGGGRFFPRLFPRKKRYFPPPTPTGLGEGSGGGARERLRREAATVCVLPRKCHLSADCDSGRWRPMSRALASRTLVRAVAAEEVREAAPSCPPNVTRRRGRPRARPGPALGPRERLPRERGGPFSLAQRSGPDETRPRLTPAPTVPRAALPAGSVHPPGAPGLHLPHAARGRGRASGRVSAFPGGGPV